jgi:hypothetical protein
MADRSRRQTTHENKHMHHGPGWCMATRSNFMLMDFTQVGGGVSHISGCGLGRWGLGNLGMGDFIVFNNISEISSHIDAFFDQESWILIRRVHILKNLSYYEDFHT